MDIIKDYWQLCKPGVVLLMIITSLTGMFLAVPGIPPLNALLWGNLGIALCAGGAAAINHTIEGYLDRLMNRTKGRPVASKRLTSLHASIFAGVLATSGFAILLLLVNPLTAYLTLLSLVGYAFIYTTYLKWATVQNVVIGGLSGAMPPLLGWTAVTNSIDAYPLILVAIIFLWNPPHFWALVLQKKKEYAKTGIPVMPVIYGDEVARLHITLYAILTSLSSFLPFIIQYAGVLYLGGAILINLLWAYRVVQIWNPKMTQAPYTLFKHSINYLGIVFLLLLLDHWLNGFMPQW
ncbi:MAG: protoheme IX farnesyltransferase [Candidatus Portiera sp.]|nr:protoheme IX farnesyltransferase [Portiera sp.]